MALTYTPEVKLHDSCPDFSVPATDGKTYSLTDFQQSPVLVVLFICNHCPYVMAIEDRIIDLAGSYKTDAVQFVSVCSNDSADYPEDSFKNIKARWEAKNYGFPYLYDEEQIMAKNFGAVCTPDIFVYDQNRKLYYRGRFDDAWKNPEAVTEQSLKQAIEACLKGLPAPETQYPSMGCSIKWKD